MCMEFHIIIVAILDDILQVIHSFLCIAHGLDSYQALHEMRMENIIFAVKDVKNLETRNIGIARPKQVCPLLVKTDN